MTALQDLRQRLSHFAEGARKRRQLKREIAQLAAMGSLDAVLADVGLVRSQIEPLVAGCTGSRSQLDKMLARLDIDPAQLPVETERDMTWTCTTCPDKRRCRRWLASSEGTDFHSFCPNAAQLDDAFVKQHPGGPPFAGSPADGSYHPTADEIRRMRADARQREVRAMIDAAL